MVDAPMTPERLDAIEEAAATPKVAGIGWTPTILNLVDEVRRQQALLHALRYVERPDVVRTKGFRDGVREEREACARVADLCAAERSRTIQNLIDGGAEPSDERLQWLDCKRSEAVRIAHYLRARSDRNSTEGDAKESAGASPTQELAGPTASDPGKPEGSTMVPTDPNDALPDKRADAPPASATYVCRNCGTACGGTPGNCTHEIPIYYPPDSPASATSYTSSNHAETDRAHRLAQQAPALESSIREALAELDCLAPDTQRAAEILREVLR